MATTTLTFKEIQDLVLDQLQELSGTTDFTLTKLKKYINLGQVDFARRTKLLTNKFDITTVANQESYAIANARFIDILHVRYIEDNTTEYGRALRLFPGGYVNLPRQKLFGTPEQFWIRYGGDNVAMEIGTIPIASASSETISVFGHNLPVDLSADGDITLINQAYHEALILYPVWKIANAYAHKSPAIRNKAIAARDEYLEIVQTALRDAGSYTTEDIQTIDIYTGNYSDDFIF